MHPTTVTVDGGADEVGDDGDERAAPAGPDLLAVAARELIGAARKALDAVEQIVDDPDPARGPASAFGDIVRQAARAGASFLTPPPPSSAPDHDDDDDGGGGVEFIKVD
jgi:hypothetical protein